MHFWISNKVLIVLCCSKSNDSPTRHGTLRMIKATSNLLFVTWKYVRIRKAYRLQNSFMGDDNNIVAEHNVESHDTSLASYGYAPFC